MSADLREEARAIADRLLDLLADPDRTVANTAVPAWAPGDGRARPAWEELTLASGFPGLSLAFSGTARRGRWQTERAHDYLTRGNAAVERTEPASFGIYAGVGAMAFATLVAHWQTGGYVTALRRLDNYITRLVRTILPLDTSGPASSNAEFEVVRGLTGLGRYLLARGDRCRAELDLVLSYLVARADGTTVHRGYPVPRWWSLAPPQVGKEAEYPGGHLNLGLAHGISGPLALLSLSWSAGVRIDGQKEAIENIIKLLQRCMLKDDNGISWPGYLTLDEWAADRADLAIRQRPSWCYGAPGVSRAVQLSGLALQRADWLELATASALACLPAIHHKRIVPDACLCHGWSGLLHLIGVLNEHIDAEQLDRARAAIATTVISHFREEPPFGYRFGFDADMSGFLDGATGVALALDAYATGQAATAWDTALLLS